MLWEIQEGFLEEVGPDLNPEWNIVVGQAEKLKRAVQTEGAMESEAAVSVTLWMENRGPGELKGLALCF